MRLSRKKVKLPQYFVRKFKLGSVSWFVKAEIMDYNLGFSYKWQAEHYKKLLAMSGSNIKAKVDRIQVDDETGLHVTY